MKNFIFALFTAMLVLATFVNVGYAHDGGAHGGDAHSGGKDVKLHVNPRWSECSFQLDPSLTQDAWREFTEEAGLVAYFRPLRDARPVGVGQVEISLLQWGTNIDDTKSAWNDTFVHPDSSHYLIEGNRLPIPGLTVRTGIAEKIDVGAYWTKNFNANYGFWGAQVQYGFQRDTSNDWAASTRLNFVSLYGPEDFGLFVYGADLLVSREFAVASDWLSVSPYAGVSGYSSNSHETAAAVDLQDEHVFGTQAMVGLVAKISVARLALEYNVAKVQTFSMKIGAEF